MSGAGYKRRVRVLFVSGGGGLAAAVAAAVANTDHPRWFEARAAGIGPWPGFPLESGALPTSVIAVPERFEAGHGGWADVVIALDAESDAACGGLPAGTQKRCHALEPSPQNEGGVTPELIAQLRERVAGMAGGLAMMQRVAR